MNSLLKKIKYLNKSLIFTFSLLGVFGVISYTQANFVTDFVATGLSATVMAVVGTVVQLIVWVMGVIISIVIWAVVHVSSYNNFIKEAPIVEAWIIIRDFCNMLFILILLIIAFGTILRIESYNVKKLLPKLIIMAILINFSKTITGLIIDASQIVMLTFINAIGSAGGNYINTLGVQTYLNNARSADWDKTLNLSSTVGGLILGVIFLMISAVVMMVLLGVLVMRIVMLWIYIVLSPLAFLLSAFPEGQKYASQWWSEFMNNVVTGPVLAFFLWLSLISANSISSLSLNDSSQCFGPSKILCPDVFVNFVVAIGMLMGGLIITQKIGGGAAGIAGKGMSAIQSGKGLAWAGIKGTGSWVGRKVKVSTGFEIRPTRIIEGIKQGLTEKTRKEEQEGEAKSASALREGGVLGLVKGLGASKDMTEAMAHGFLYNKGFKLAYQTAKAKKWKKELGELDVDKAELDKTRKKLLKPLEDEESDLDYELNDSGTSVSRSAQIIERQKQIDKDKARINAEKDKEEKKLDERRDFLNKNIRTPYTFAADQGRSKNVKDAMSKIGDNDNSDDLIDMWRHAKAVGDKEMAAAVFLASAKNGHSNEIIMAEKGTGNAKTEQYKEQFKGKTYTTDQDGLNAFVQEQFMGELKMSEQEALNYQSQFSSICKGVGHFMFAESVGSKNGLLVQKSKEDQQSHARAELRKVDPEKVTRDRNRFGYGHEYEGSDGKRYFSFDKIGLQTVTENAGRIWAEIGMNRMNKNAAMKMTDDIKTLRAYLEEVAKKNNTDLNGGFTKAQNGEVISYEKFLKELERYGKEASLAAGDDENSYADAIKSALEGKNRKK